MAARLLSLCLLVALLSSCTLQKLNKGGKLGFIEPQSMALVSNLILTELESVVPPKRKPVIAIYRDAFTDLTGARRSNSQYADFSTAVTQAPDAYLIRALKHAGGGQFFDVVERVGLDNVTKERQLIRSTRQQFKENQDLLPLAFAGLLMHGGVIGYESNLKSGGFGARYLGIGADKEYRQDTVTISLRTVSVSTGKVLLEVLVTKSILSVGYSQDTFRFIAEGTKLIEIENGIVQNESVGIALQTAIETAVLETVRQGYDAGYWKPITTKPRG